MCENGQSYLPEIADFKAEFAAHGESDICGGGGLQSFDNLDNWLAYVVNNQCEETVKPGLVPATVYIGVVDDQGVGILDIRHRLNSYLANIGGNIGYCVRPAKRRLGYAKAMLSLALSECPAFGMNRVLITCSKSNVASANTIKSCGGVMENEVVDGEGVIKQRYWIEL